MHNKYRKVKTRNGVFSTPRHITRVENPGYRWQLRFDRRDEPYYSRCFSDNVHGGTHQALNAAIACLERIQKQYRLTEQIVQHKTNANLIFWRVNPNRPNQRELWADIYLCSYNGYRYTVSFFVCTENNYTPEKKAEALRACCRIRNWAASIIAKKGRNKLATYKTPPEPDNHLTIIGCKRES